MEESKYLQTDRYARNRSLRRPRFSERSGILKVVIILRKVWSWTKQCARPLLPPFSGFVCELSRYRILKVAIPLNGFGTWKSCFAKAHMVQPACHEKRLDRQTSGWFAHADDDTHLRHRDNFRCEALVPDWILRRDSNVSNSTHTASRCPRQMVGILPAFGYC